MATINGSPNAPARTNDCGVPPTPSQMQCMLHGAWIDPLPGQRRPECAGPRDVLVPANLEEQLELLGEQRVVVLEVESEQRKRLDG